FEAAGNPLALVELPVGLPLDELGKGALSSSPLPLTARLELAFATHASELPPVTQTLLLVAAVDDGGDLDEVLSATQVLEGAGGAPWSGCRRDYCPGARGGAQRAPCLSWKPARARGGVGIRAGSPRTRGAAPSSGRGVRACVRGLAAAVVAAGRIRRLDLVRT